MWPKSSSRSIHVVRVTPPPNSALVTDACAAALRAFYSAAQRGR